MMKKSSITIVNVPQTQKPVKEWQFEFAAKMVDSWPSWKKEIYESNFSNKHDKKAISVCK